MGELRVKINNAVHVTGTFRDVDEALYDPTGGVSVEVTKPDSTTASGSATQASTGVYTYVLNDPDQLGRWYIRFYNTTDYVTDTISVRIIPALNPTGSDRG